jgi:hypothetical protein
MRVSCGSGSDFPKCDPFLLERLFLNEFEAEVPLIDKVCRVANGVVFGAGLYGVYALARGSAGTVSYPICLAVVLTARKVLSALIGHIAYPATWLYSQSSLKEDEKIDIQRLVGMGYIVNKITLYKSGTAYDATLVTSKDTIENGKWTMNALGNAMAIEQVTASIALENFSRGSNTLLINGPSVGASKGWATRYQMGAGFEAGLQFLEKEIKATHIAMRGLSLGGGMIAEAVLQHDFTEGMSKKIQYLCISDRTFSKLSSVASALVGRLVEPLFYLAGMELDGVAAGFKLSSLGIHQIVVQHKSGDFIGSDGVIPDQVSLAKKILPMNKRFIVSSQIRHNGPLPRSDQEQLDIFIDRFMQKA